MLAKRIIPCLDVADGRVVKGIKFQELRDAGDPVEAAKRYCEAGADELAVLDISASEEGRKTTLDLVERIASEVFIPLMVGGGISELKDIKALLRAGADKVSINTSAVLKPDLIRQAAETFGSQCITVAIDVKKDGAGGWKVFTHGGKKETDLDAIEWAEQVAQLGAGEILLTSMDNDGGLNGFDLDITSKISDKVSIPVIASGGVGNLQHLADGVTHGKADAVLAASIFHFGTYTIKQAKEVMQEAGIPVRPPKPSHN